MRIVYGVLSGDFNWGFWTGDFEGDFKWGV